MSSVWKLSTILKAVNRQRKGITNILLQGRRFFLSEAYQCRPAWEKRLEAPLLQSVNFGELHNEMEQKYKKEGVVNILDIDLFANAIKEDLYLEELEDLIYKLRLSKNTTSMLPSTPHAFIRYYVDIGKYEELYRVLDDRLNYGIFPDDYTFCLLLDTLIKQNKITEAVRISTLNMLQEDWSNQLGLHLALYACHQYMLNPKPWELEPEEPPFEEEIKIRVNYIRNPYFDDHFDLRDPSLLIGKTMFSIGKEVPGAVGYTFQLVGLGLYQKWEKVLSLLESLKKNNVKPSLFKSGLDFFNSLLNESLEKEKVTAQVKSEIESILKGLEAQDLITNDDLHAAIMKKVETVVAAKEKTIIEEQEKAYAEWEVCREKIFKESLAQMKKQEVLERIQKEKELLAQKEETIFFFDNEDKVDLLLEEAEQKLVEDAEKTIKVKVKSKDKEEEEYIPPLV